jgi:hypothetical protein
VCGSESISLYVGITTSVLIGVILAERAPVTERAGPDNEQARRRDLRAAPALGGVV